MESAKRFVFHAPAVDFASSTATFPYTVEYSDGRKSTFQEILVFPATEVQWKSVPTELLKKLLQSVSLALGVSYYKMHCAPEIALAGFALSSGQAAFWNTLYTKGLGEFFYRNQIDFRGLPRAESGGLINFPSDPNTKTAPSSLERADRSLVPIGGGKDSIVTAELLEAAGKEFDLLELGTSPVQEEIAALIGKRLITVPRTLDPEMIRLSKAGEAYNGHVPISAIYFFVGLLTAALLDYRYVIFSNERSADAGNVEYLGATINHQWSKTLEFETLARDYVRANLTPDIEAFSLLRPVSELAIVERFAKYPKYFNAFSSCNRNFAQRKPLPERKGHAYWCGACPKCAFVFACLAACLPEATVVDIFGKNLFADSALVPLYKELLGLEAFKPFECVGEPEEVIAAFDRAVKTGAYENLPAAAMFEEYRSQFGNIPKMEERVFAVGDTATLPEQFRGILK